MILCESPLHKTAGRLVRVRDYGVVRLARWTGIALMNRRCFSLEDSCIGNYLIRANLPGLRKCQKNLIHRHSVYTNEPHNPLLIPVISKFLLQWFYSISIVSFQICKKRRARIRICQRVVDLHKHGKLSGRFQSGKNR